jgi:hypothetical protein
MKNRLMWLELVLGAATDWFIWWWIWIRDPPLKGDRKR